MELNTAVQLGLEQALKALIPYLQSLDDPDGFWDFLDIFPVAGPEANPTTLGFLFMAGHEAARLPDDKTSYLAFIAALPDYRAISQRYPQIPVRLELGVAGIADEATREAATLLYSQ